MPSGANAPIVSSYNRDVVLDAVRSHATISRVEISALTGLTQPTVSGIVRRLIDEGFVLEAGRGESTGGKPRTLLRLNPAACYAVGVQIDFEATTYVLVDMEGSEVARLRQASRGRSEPETVISRVGQDVPELLAKAGVDPARVVGVGIASPGPIDHRTGVVLHPPNLPQWGEVPLRKRLEQVLGMPVALDNDATAAAVGEQWAGGGDTPSSFLALYMGAGIGSGIVIDDQPYRGATSNAGEVGHISMNVDGTPCHCGNVGCLESYSAPRAIVAAARQEWRDADGELVLAGRGTSVQADFAKVAKAAAAGDAYAAGLVERSARYLGAAVVSVVNLLDLPLVVLCGPAFDGLGQFYTSAIETALRTQTLARERQDVVVRVSPIAADAAAVGAAALVLHKEFAPRLRGLRRVGAG